MSYLGRTSAHPFVILDFDSEGPYRDAADVSSFLASLQADKNRTFRLHDEITETETRLTDLLAYLELTREVATDTQAELRRLIIDHIGGTDDDVDLFIDEQFCYFLNGEVSLDAMAVRIDMMRDRLRNAVKAA
jgi:hypothetical protein